MEPASDGRGILTIRWHGRFSSVAAAILGTAAWAAVLYLVLRRYSAEAARLSFVLQAVVVIVCVLGIAGGLFLAVCQIYGGRAIFDPTIHTVIIGGLTGKRSAMSFESVARVAPMEEVTFFSARVVFCLVPKLSPLFGVRAISGPFRRESEKYADFERRVIPEITRMLRIERTRTGRGGVSALPTAHYRKAGSCYIKNFAEGFVRDIVGAVIPLILLPLLSSLRARMPDIPSITVFWAMFCVYAAVGFQVTCGFVFFFFSRVRSICIDRNALELRVKRGIFGWGGVCAHPFSSVKRFGVFWRASLGATSSRIKVFLIVDGARETVEVISYGRPGKDIADEMKFLAGMFGLDPVRDITYKRSVINIFAD